MDCMYSKAALHIMTKFHEDISNTFHFIAKTNFSKTPISYNGRKFCGRALCDVHSSKWYISVISGPILKIQNAITSG